MSGPKRYRLLSEEEIDLWRAVASTVVPRHGSSLPKVPPPVTAPISMKPEHRATHPPMPPYVPPQSAPKSALPPLLTALERRYRQKVKRGRVDIERVMDLHGLNQAEAHGAMRGFLRTAQQDGARLVLVVTGKGRLARNAEGPQDNGVLRRAVPHWLREPDLRMVVLGFEEASQPHGGSGALYIRLRRRPAED